MPDDVVWALIGKIFSFLGTNKCFIAYFTSKLQQEKVGSSRHDTSWASGQPPPYTINTDVANVNAGANVGKGWRQQGRETGAWDAKRLELQVHFSFLLFFLFLTKLPFIYIETDRCSTQLPWQQQLPPPAQPHPSHTATWWTAWAWDVSHLKPLACFL